MTFSDRHAGEAPATDAGTSAFDKQPARPHAMPQNQAEQTALPPTVTPRRLVWVSNIHLEQTLDAATWVETATSLCDLGWQVTLVVEGEPGTVELGPLTVVRFPRSTRYLMGQISYHAAITRYLRARRHEIDVVLFHQMAALWILPMRLQGRAGNRPLLVMDTRDLSDITKGDWKARLRNSFSHLAHRTSDRWADGQTAITDGMVELVGISSRKLLGIWPSGVTVEHFAAAPATRQWPTGNDPIRLVYIGILLEKRNLLPLAQAVARANQAGMNFQLSLYGDGSFRPVLEEFAGRHAGVELFAPIPRSQVPLALGQAHVGVTSLPAVDDIKYQASSPIKLFEYLAAGMPILATSNLCHTSVVGDGAYAFWVDDVDEASLLAGLEAIWAQRAELPALGGAAGAAAQDWTWQAAAKKLDAALRRGLARQTAA